MYAYAGNNPVKYTDPDGEKMGMPYSAKENMLAHYMGKNQSITQTDALRTSLVKAEGNFHHGMPVDKWGIKRTDTYGIYAVKSGRVTIVQSGKNQSADYGNSIIITDTEGRQLRYAHLDSIDVKEGDWINEGSRIGIMGNTGKGFPTPNKHLHVSLYPKDAQLWGSNAIDPTEYIQSGTYPCNTKETLGFGAIVGTGSFNYPHEGIDFSSRTQNLIDNWQYGLSGQELN